MHVIRNVHHFWHLYLSKFHFIIICDTFGNLFWKKFLSLEEVDYPSFYMYTTPGICALQTKVWLVVTVYNVMYYYIYCRFC